MNKEFEHIVRKTGIVTQEQYRELLKILDLEFGQIRERDARFKKNLTE